MYRGKTTGVVVPAYNEAEFVGDVLETIPDFVDRVYVVDDHSTDGTWEVIQQHVNLIQRRGPDEGVVTQSRYVPLRHDDNKGVGGAIKTGYREAVNDGMDVIAVMNGDGQMDPDILDRIIEPVAEGETDYAKGDRLTRPDHRRPMSRWRLFGNVILTILTCIASGYWDLRDSQNGYTAISNQALETLRIDEMYEDYGFLNDMLIRLNAHGMSVTDVRMPSVYGDEESGIRYTEFVPRILALLARGFVWRLKVKYLSS